MKLQDGRSAVAPAPVPPDMKAWQLMGVVWWIFGGAVAVASDFHGGTEAEVRQGTLSRWSAWWAPEEGTEGRFWWDPDGGAAWLRIGEFQFGPLQEVPGPEGSLEWGPAVRQSGTWGAAWSGSLVGIWALQRTNRLEAGGQVSWAEGPGSWGAGAARSWELGPEGPGPQWTDRGFVGGTWTGPAWKAGAEVRASAPESGTVVTVFSGRLSAGDHPWDVEAKAQTTVRESWSARCRLRWEDGPWRLEGAWDRTEGASARAVAQGTLGTLTPGVDASARLQEGRWAGSAGVSVSAKAGRGRWKLGWTVVPEPAGTVQKAEASWKMPGLEATADWTVEGFRLGWFGPGSRLTWTLRWLF